MQVTGLLSFDSRDIAPDGLFACLKGRALDGHTFAAQAVVALASRLVDAPAVIRARRDPMFLDWIFWCYLCTIELSDRLLAHQTAQTSMATP